MEISSQTSQLPPCFFEPLSQKEWMRIIHRCLVYLSDNDPHSSENLYKEERQVLPNTFFNSKAPAQFCYPFKGIFLPSGNLDGRVWKPSQGARPTGDGLMKRYFYFKEGGVKIKRQVIWLTSNENWCFLDYRCNFKGKIIIQQMQLPTGLEFFKLLGLIEKVCLVGLEADTTETIRKRKTLEQEEQRVANQLGPFSESGPEYFLNVPTMFEDDPDSEPLGLDEFMRTFEEDGCTLPMEEPLINPFVNEERISHNLPSNEIVPKKRKVEIIPVPIPVPVISVPSTQSPISSYYSFSFSPFDYLLNHILSYDQILDTVCQSLCTQLIFNRNYFFKSGLDPNTLLQSLMQRCTVISVDFTEFPSNLMSTFFRWLYESVFQVPPSKVPSMYCMVCGCAENAQHDVKTHTKFYGCLDKALLENWKNKASNFYDVLKELIGFLLKYPNSRPYFCSIIATHLHCPYCSRKNGTHCEKKHEEWRVFYKFEKPETSLKEPEQTDNLATYTKASFEYLMEQMPFQIPSFLLSLSNVQSFLDCLMTLWKSMRLFSY